jgi:hypothetical protein
MRRRRSPRFFPVSYFGTSYQQAEIEARQQRRGLWQQENPAPIPPWEYRHPQRSLPPSGALLERPGLGAISADTGAARALRATPADFKFRNPTFVHDPRGEQREEELDGWY